LIREAIQDTRERSMMPRHPRHSDLYIVEFPRSGITWLTTLLANAALIESGREEIASFFNAGVYVPDIHISRDLGDAYFDRPPVRMIKSHSKWNSGYGFVIYLARNPLSVMKSYYRYLHQNGRNPHHDFEIFCRSEIFGIPEWKRHVQSWLAGAPVANRLYLVRYEDLEADAAGELRAISECFGWNLGPGAIDGAVIRSSVERMKANETLYRRHNPKYTATAVRNEVDVQVTDGVAAYIETQCAEECRLLRYI